MLIDVSKEPTVLNLRVQREREKAHEGIYRSTEPVLQAIAGACNRRFGGRKKLVTGDLQGISDLMMTEFDKTVTSIVSFDHKREATRVRPKGDAIEHVRMFVGPGTKDDQRRASIWTLHLYATRKYAMVDFRRFPSTWKAHASARMHERVEVDVDAEREVAQAVMLEHFMVSAATDAIAELGLPPRLAIPCREGLLLGNVASIDPYESGSFRWQFTRIGTQDFDVPSRFIFRQGGYPELLPTWTAQTFIGPNEMRPTQEEYVARFGEIRNRFKHAADQAVQILTIGTSFIRPLWDAATAEPEYQRMIAAYEEAKASLKVLLSIPRFALACGNDIPARLMEPPFVECEAPTPTF